MAAVLDTLQILIEADAGGLESQLKKGASTIQSFIAQMNDEEVNWETILAGSLSPTLITGVAATVALAITNAIQMQNSLISAQEQMSGAAGAGQGTAASLGAAGASIGATAYSLSSQFTPSAQDTASALADLQKQLGYTADESAALGPTVDATAQILGITATQAAADYIGVLKQLGTPASQAQTVMNELFTQFQNSAYVGASGFQQMLELVTAVGPAFEKDGVSVNTLAAGIAALSTTSGVSLSDVSTDMNLLANNINTPLNALSTLYSSEGNIGKEVNDAGIIGTLQDISTHIKDSANLAPAIGQAIGLNATQVANLGVVSNSAWDTAKAKAVTYASELTDVVELVKNNETEMNKLQIAWNTFIAGIATSPITGWLVTAITWATDLLNIFNEVDTVISKVTTFLSNPGAALTGIFGDLFKGVTAGVANIGNTGAAGLLESLGSANTGGPAGSLVGLSPSQFASENVTDASSATNVIDAILQYNSGKLGPGLAPGGGNFSADQVQSVISSATQGADLQALAQALQKGLAPTAYTGSGTAGQINFANNFTINGGGNALNPQQIVNLLYQQFQGVK